MKVLYSMGSPGNIGTWEPLAAVMTLLLLAAGGWSAVTLETATAPVY